MSQPISHIHIAYGSESGNTEALAKQLHQLDWLQAYQPSLCTLNELDFSRLQADDLLLILTSSFGDSVWAIPAMINSAVSANKSKPCLIKNKRKP